MKHIRLALAFALVLMLISAFTAIADENARTGKDLKIGDTFIFGAVEQDYDFKDDDYLFRLEPIEWIVIDKTSDKALLLSKQVLTSVPYHSEKVDVTWENSDIREYLNSTFMDNCFSESEKAAILKTKVKNNSDRNTEWNTSGGNDTEDYLFLLSYNEATGSIPYLREEKKRITSATVFAAKVGVDESFGKNGWWWLRLPGKKQNEAAYITGNGSDYRHF